MAIYFVFLFEEQIVASKKKQTWLFIVIKTEVCVVCPDFRFSLQEANCKVGLLGGGYWRNWVSPQVSSWVEIGAPNVRQPIASVEQNYVFFSVYIAEFYATHIYIYM